jgi:hypothetical protein
VKSAPELAEKSAEQWWLTLDGSPPWSGLHPLNPRATRWFNMWWPWSAGMTMGRSLAGGPDWMAFAPFPVLVAGMVVVRLWPQKSQAADSSCR